MKMVSIGHEKYNNFEFVQLFVNKIGEMFLFILTFCSENCQKCLTQLTFFLSESYHMFSRVEGFSNKNVGTCHVVVDCYVWDPKSKISL